MDLKLAKIIDSALKATNRNTIFDELCFLQLYIENNNDELFFEEVISKTGRKYKTIKKEISSELIYRILNNKIFIDNLIKVSRYIRDNRNYTMESIPNDIIANCNYVNLSMHLCFYIISHVSNKLTQENIKFIGNSLYFSIKQISKEILYEFDISLLISTLEKIIFEHKFAYTKKYPVSFDDKNFYPTLKKNRLIIGNYLLDFSIPIITSNAFNRIKKLKAIHKNEFKITKSISILSSAFDKYKFIKNGFLIKEIDPDTEKENELGSFLFYFKNRESNKIFFLLETMIDGLRYDDGIKDEDLGEKIIKKINASHDILNKIKNFFVESFCVFKIKVQEHKKGQWSNKSFLNTIKFFSIMETINKSPDNSWKIDTFIKYFHEWIDDIDDNINYFSNIDDYEEIKGLLKTGENDKIEFKSTFGFPLQGYKDTDQAKIIKKETEEKIAETIISMANSFGGDIFVGVVEKIDKIRDENVLLLIDKKDGINFIDVIYSLKNENSDFDSKRLKMQQLLVSMTGERMDFLDSLFNFRFYKILIEDKQKYINILNIHVKKSGKIIFMKNNGWITLPKRLNGRVEKLNPAEEIRKSLDNN